MRTLILTLASAFIAIQGAAAHAESRAKGTIQAIGRATVQVDAAAQARFDSWYRKQAARKKAQFDQMVREFRTCVRTGRGEREALARLYRTFPDFRRLVQASATGANAARDVEVSFTLTIKVGQKN